MCRSGHKENSITHAPRVPVHTLRMLLQYAVCRYRESLLTRGTMIGGVPMYRDRASTTTTAAVSRNVRNALPCRLHSLSRSISRRFALDTSQTMNIPGPTGGDPTGGRTTAGEESGQTTADSGGHAERDRSQSSGRSAAGKVKKEKIDPSTLPTIERLSDANRRDQILQPILERPLLADDLTSVRTEFFRADAIHRLTWWIRGRSCADEA